ncbi:ribonuclease P protein subunit p29-like [Nylanderia fulva]|uniref:ribonuclease P protein subunit p29-like n=1 Tax=Nylanderia fulva TaxID=613905 RepID=UPI0010FAFC0C|nr:ribonuclease P protein subunit p29-like [Nylanderia fulva]
MSQQEKLCTPLPRTLTSHINICANSEQYVFNFLQNSLPPSDCKCISDEMRKTFIFNKFKVKCRGRHTPKGKFLSARKRLQFDLGKIGNKSQIKYSDLLPLNQLWLNYMRTLLGVESFTSIPENSNNPNWENVSQQLIKADLHGAKISIDKSKCPTLVGVTGIVIQDTKNTFRICGLDNVIRTIPKDVVKINIYLGNGVILKAFGRQLSIRPVERAVKNIKIQK